MGRVWLDDDDDELTFPTNMRDVVWGVLITLLGLAVLITMPIQPTIGLLAVGWLGTLTGLGLLVKGLAS
jgi:hypothetical protein